MESYIILLYFIQYGNGMSIRISPRWTQRNNHKNIKIYITLASMRNTSHVDDGGTISLLCKQLAFIPAVSHIPTTGKLATQWKIYKIINKTINDNKKKQFRYTISQTIITWQFARFLNFFLSLSWTDNKLVVSLLQ